MSHLRLPAALLACIAVLAAACGSTTTTATKGAKTGPLGSKCAPASLKTVKSGVLTLGADDPLYEPWYADNNPTNGKGFEDAVAYAIAKELGYAKADVHWTRVTFNAAIQPGPKSFDYDLDEFSITAQRAQAVDFSAPYYTVHQAVIALKGTSAAKLRTLAAVRKLQLGVQVGTTTSYTAIVDQIKPAKSPRIYNSNNDAEAALKDGQIQGVVTDLPTAFAITTGEVKGTAIVGQLQAPTGHPERFGALLNKNSPLTSCVDKAVKAITADGTLAGIQKKWLTEAGSAPVLQ